MLLMHVQFHKQCSVLICNRVKSCTLFLLFFYFPLKYMFMISAFLLLFSGMWMGLFPRIIMIGTLTALQWFIYDSVKVTLRLPRPPPPSMPESMRKRLEAQQNS